MNEGRFYKLYTETTTGGRIREVYAKEGGNTGDVISFEDEIKYRDQIIWDNAGRQTTTRPMEA